MEPKFLSSVFSVGIMQSWCSSCLQGCTMTQEEWSVNSPILQMGKVNLERSPAQRYEAGSAGTPFYSQHKFSGYQDFCLNAQPTGPSINPRDWGSLPSRMRGWSPEVHTWLCQPRQRPQEGSHFDVSTSYSSWARSAQHLFVFDSELGTFFTFLNGCKQ